MSEKVLYTGKTHTTGGKEGYTRSSDGAIDIKLPDPHPTAEKLFASAWSACYIGAIELAAMRKKIKLPNHPAVDAEIDLVLAGDAFFLRARLSVSIAGVDRDVVQDLAETAHGICPYSKAVHGNINIVTTVV